MRTSFCLLLCVCSLFIVVFSQMISVERFKYVTFLFKVVKLFKPVQCVALINVE